MHSSIDTSFATGQRDVFESGLVNEIGANAYTVWMAIKHHADYSTGRAWPGMRRLAKLTGLAVNTVNKAVHTLVGAKLLRIASEGGRGRGQVYVARERLTVRLGERVLCTIVIDYIPVTIRDALERIDQALRTGKNDPDAFTEVEIIPGSGFAWDASAGVLRAAIPTKDIPKNSSPEPTETAKQALKQLRDEVTHRPRPKLIKR